MGMIRLKAAEADSSPMRDTAAAQWRRRAITTRTLADLDYKLEIQCRGCRRTIVAEPGELRRMFPRPTFLSQLARKLRCRRCGEHNPRLWVWVMGWTRDKRRRRS